MSGVYLTRRDPGRNISRFYRMLIVPTLFGEWVLLREWGRIGSGGTVRADPFPNAGAALLAMQSLVRAKHSRGYMTRQASVPGGA
ncbi:MAG: WGR domain-containing protein [Phreatobacter sp.]|nr:WGR domain-containing protein [Phreatobacter sp.]